MQTLRHSYLLTIHRYRYRYIGGPALALEFEHVVCNALLKIKVVQQQPQSEHGLQWVSLILSN